MTRTEAKYVLDTSVFIQGWRDPGANRELYGFHEALAPFDYLSAV